MASICGLCCGLQEDWEEVLHQETGGGVGEEGEKHIENMIQGEEDFKR